ncbi:U32 family peptidase [Chlamydiota bacterium]
MRKPELVVPAGNREKLEIAITYGADAVYLGGEFFNLRVNAGNFDVKEMIEAVEYVHNNRKKVYLALNSFFYDKDIDKLKEYIKQIKQISFDGIIVSDPGMIDFVKKAWPKIGIHLSTQANTMNRFAANFWRKNGIDRIVLARELTLQEITSITNNTSIQIETFIHGSVCLSFSGRCYLSKYMSGRDANLGNCSQSCRWSYSLMEEKRPGEYYPVYEDDDMSYILNAEDICSIKILDKLLETGVNAVKIEGRMKSSYYLAVVTMVYRQAIDSFVSKKAYSAKKEWIDELERISHRPYNYEPYSGKKMDVSQKDEISRAKGTVLALVTGMNSDGYTCLSVRNSLRKGENIDIISPHKIVPTNIVDLKDKEGISREIAHPNQEISVKLSKPVGKNDFLRRRK